MAATVLVFQNSIGQTEVMAQKQPLPSNVVSKETFTPSHKMSDKKATVQQSVFYREQNPEPLPSGVGQTEVLAFQNQVNRKTATVKKSAFPLKNFPDPEPSGVGQTDVFVYQRIVRTGSAVIQPKLFLDQYPVPLQSNLGSTLVEVAPAASTLYKTFIQHKAFIREQYPAPLPSKIGQEDLPGGFRHEAVMSGQSRAIYNLARGVVQIDGIKVLFDAQA
ncbi:MAG: hypothetical protein JXB48_20550 [Candidatus Latescibacteria bacterium]|nr:hypothetical protein [Candidatus Latescibacterota bacterium]